MGTAGIRESSTIKIVVKNVIERNGIAIEFSDRSDFINNFRALREVQPDIPVVVLMEDIDEIIRNANESRILQILDGMENLDKVVFLATTNYPERLGDRFINRPSRFDRRFKIGHPLSESRKMYLDYLFSSSKDKKLIGKIDIEKWTEDTEGFSISHIKELFVAVCILGESYDETLSILNTMKEESVSSSQDEDDFYKPKFGFVTKVNA